MRREREREGGREGEREREREGEVRERGGGREGKRERWEGVGEILATVCSPYQIRIFHNIFPSPNSYP